MKIATTTFVMFFSLFSCTLTSTGCGKPSMKSEEGQMTEQEAREAIFKASEEKANGLGE
ncbi:secreted protein [Rhodopirellula sp. SWK7]|nr:secreted protein [Rhodopirellula sp. SWK7]